MQYTIITGMGMEKPKFEAKIERMLAEGWKLVGGVSAAVTSDDQAYFAQAMIKEERVVPNR